MIILNVFADELRIFFGGEWKKGRHLKLIQNPHTIADHL